MPSVRRVQLDWTGEGLRFRGAGSDPVTPPIEVDGDNASAPGPMLQLLLAAAACSASDVVLILDKMRQPLTGLSVGVTGTRRDDDPKRYTEIRFAFRARGEGLERPKVERAVGLSLDKYCSVVHSLAPDIQIDSEVVLD